MSPEVETAALPLRYGSRQRTHQFTIFPDDKVIKRWVQEILTPLAKALCDTKEVDTLAMQSKTIPLLMKLDPDYTPPAGASDNKFSTTIILSILVALIAAIVAMFVMNGGFIELIKNLK